MTEMHINVWSRYLSNFILPKDAKSCDKRRLHKIECLTKYEQKLENVAFRIASNFCFVFPDKVFLFMLPSKQIYNSFANPWYHLYNFQVDEYKNFINKTYQFCII